MECLYCGRPDVEWLHELDWERSRFGSAGSMSVWGSPASFCGRCESLFVAGDDEALLTLYVELGEGADADYDVRASLAALRASVVTSVRYDDTIPDGGPELREEGFTPVDWLTGEPDVVLAWPDAHKRSVPETRSDHIDDAVEGRFWLVRSPWPGIDLDDVMSLFWSHVEGGRRWGGPDQATRGASLFQLSAEEARSLLAD